MSKRRFLISPLAAAATLLAFGAQAQVTVQGFADGAWRSVSNSKGTVQSVVSGSGTTSRLIFRGTEDLGGGWSAGFWLESTFFIDSGNVTTTQFFDRQSTVRLAGPMGEFRMGRDWVPSFMSYAAADIMGYVGVGVAGNLISATGMEAIKRAFGTFTPTTSRSNNSIEYLTPASLGNLYGHAMIAFSEDSNSAGNFKLKGGRMGYRASGWDVSAHYTGTQIPGDGCNLEPVRADRTLDHARHRHPRERRLARYQVPVVKAVQSDAGGGLPRGCPGVQGHLRPSEPVGDERCRREH